MKMTKVNALNAAMNYIPEDNTEVREIIKNMISRLENRSSSPEASAKRKEATAKARAELIERVAPVLRKYLDTPKTAKELFAAAQSELPEDFSAPKVQNILIREMAPELNKVETKNKANTYCLK